MDLKEEVGLADILSSDRANARKHSCPPIVDYDAQEKPLKKSFFLHKDLFLMGYVRIFSGSSPNCVGLVMQSDQ